MKSAIFFLAIFSIFYFSANAQPKYIVSVTSGKTYDALPGNYITLSTTTNLTKTRIPIGFYFRYWGQLQDSVSVNGNGQLSFSDFREKDTIDAIFAGLQATSPTKVP